MQSHFEAQKNEITYAITFPPFSLELARNKQQNSKADPLRPTRKKKQKKRKSKIARL